jgi:hypothetical protein
VKTCDSVSSLDHYLVARAQASATGARAHDVYALLGNYYEICRLAQADSDFAPRQAALEQRLRAICQGVMVAPSGP